MDPSVLRLTRTLVPRPSEGGQASPYVLILQGQSSGVQRLPQNGVLLIGRGAEADLALEDDSVSRRHARLITSGGAARLVDLGSHNGTRVNGVSVTDTVALAPGDVLHVGVFTLVLRTALAAPPSTAGLVEPEELEQRLTHELARASAYGRSASVAVALVSQGPAAQADAGDARSSLRPLDLISAAGPGELRGLFPEASASEALAQAKRWAAQLGPAARIGLATFPDDGVDPHTLWAAARAAAGGQAPVRSASELDCTIAVGDRTVLVADPAMVHLYELVRRLARSDLPVLVTGETGAGKENAAYAVHAWSPRAQGRFVTLNCAALSESLLESELFGHEKGAFTGALAVKPGLLEAAAGGSVFLDEVGELSLSAQAKLLRAIETRTLVRVGGTTEREVDFRVVAATNRVLEDEVAAGRFREDLYFRLSAATVVLPPLRDRPREIPLLARSFLQQACRKLSRRSLALAPSAMRALCAYGWPGNVRELRNAIEYTAAAALDGPVEASHLPPKLTASPKERGPAAPTAAGPTFARLADELQELELRRMREALEAAAGVQTRAAELIGMPVRTFVFKLKRHGLRATA